MKFALKEKAEYLTAYAPGNGFIAFTWSDSKGIATARTVTLGDVKKYLSRKTLGGHYLAKGYRIVRLSENAEPLLAPPVARVNAHTLNVGGKEFAYFCKKRGERFHDRDLVLKTDGHSVKHLSTRCQVLGFLEHEAVLTEQAAGL